MLVVHFREKIIIIGMEHRSRKKHLQVCSLVPVENRSPHRLSDARNTPLVSVSHHPRNPRAAPALPLLQPGCRFCPPLPHASCAPHLASGRKHNKSTSAWAYDPTHTKQPKLHRMVENSCAKSQQNTRLTFRFSLYFLYKVTHFISNYKMLWLFFLDI